jgi:hypothetical protein
MRHLVMSSEVETSLILIRFLKRREIHRLLRASPKMLTNEFSDVGLASLQEARLGFPAENAMAAGKRRHILRSNAFADK